MIKIGICGYGNLGKGVESACLASEDMQLVGIFTRRDPKGLKTKSNSNVYPIDDLPKFQNSIDVLILCGGSATDLPQQTKEYAKFFHVVDSFDTHAMIPTHYQQVHENAILSNKVAIISTGWDPGLFSLNRILMETVLPKGKDYTFWGKGVSQGHSDAIRRIPGVADARQYTIPKEEALEIVRSGKNPNLSIRDKHLRDCYVVLEEHADPKVVEETIKAMPNYFSDYDTYVHFINQKELDEKHKKIPHGGFVIRTGQTNEGVHHKLEFSLELDSNPEFTGSVLVAYARACYRLAKEKNFGCKTVFDIAPKYLSIKNYDELLKHTL